MRTRLTLLIATLTVAGVAVPSAASAATLYTTAAHTTAVPVGTTITASIPTGLTWKAFLASGPQYEECPQNNLTFKVTKNSAGVFEAENTGNTWPAPNCIPIAHESIAGGKVKISGASVVNGTNTAWLGTTLNLKWKWNGSSSSFTGNFESATGTPPKNGVFAQQPTTAKTPVSLVLDKAWKAEGVMGYTGTVSTTYTLTGTAAAYSLG